MYEYSLSSYLGVFDTALRDAKPDKIVDNRLKTLACMEVDSVTIQVPNSTHLGLQNSYEGTRVEICIVL